MRTLLSIVLIAGVAAFVGCTDKSGTGGGSQKNDQFKIAVKDTFKQGQNIKQGEKLKIPITIDRGKDFKDPVKLSVEDKDVPKGVKVSFDPAEVPGDQTTSDMTVEVAEKDSATGKQTIKVHAKPAKGEATSLNVELNVEEKK